MHRNNALLLTTAVLLSLPAGASQFNRWENRREAQGAFRIAPELSFLSTSSNYGPDGSAVTPSGLDYSKTLMDVNLSYGMSKDLTAFGRLGFASIDFQTSSLKGSGYGLADQAIGLNYHLSGSESTRAQWDGQIQAEFPLYDKAGARRKDPPDPLLGDGTFDVTIGPFLTYKLSDDPTSRLFLVTGLGATIRGGGFSTTLPYQLALAIRPESSGFVGSVGLRGTHPLSSDGTATALDSGATNKDAGDSLIVNALNSSSTSARLVAGYLFSPDSQLHLAYEKTLRGASTANLSAITIGAQFRFGGGKVSTSAEPGQNGQKKSARRLKYDLEGMVTQTNDRLNLVKVNLGSQDGVQKGHVFDIYRAKPNGAAGELIARGQVRSVRENEAVILIRQYAKQVVIQAGFTAKRLVR